MDNTNAERQRRYIQRLKARAAGVSNAPDTAAALEQALAEAKARVAVLEALPGPGPADLTLGQYADAMIARLRGSSLCEVQAWCETFNERLEPLARELGAAERKPKRPAKAQAAKAGVSNAPDTAGEIAALKQELAQARTELKRANARITELEAGQGQTKAGAGMKAEIAALKDENHAFRVELGRQNHVIKTRDGGGLTNAQFKKFEMVFHPDNSASKETREWASRIFRQLRYVLCNEAELPSMDPRKFHITFRKLWERRQETIKRAKKDRQRRGRPKASPRPSKNLPKR